MWGIIGCIMSFAISLVSERVHGTFVRLQMAPLTRASDSGRQGARLLRQHHDRCRSCSLRSASSGFGIRISSIPLLVLACATRIGRLRRLHDDDCGHGPHRAGRGRRRLGDAHADDDVRRRHDAAVRDAAVDADGRQSEPGEVGDPRASRARSGAASRSPRWCCRAAILLAFGAVCFAVGVRGLRD